MSVLMFLGIVFIAGGVGGLVNALLNDRGLVIPQPVKMDDGTRIIRPGCVGNMLIGAVAASLSWLLYGSYSQPEVVISAAALATVGGAVLVGMVGSSWLTNKVGKDLFQAVASMAAAGPSNVDASKRLLNASPAQALDIAKQMQSGQLDGSTSLPTPTPTPR